MTDGVITYETFRKFQRQEKENDALQRLPDNFYDLCKEWIRRKENLYEKGRDPSMLREIENVMLIIKDIMERRERKLLTLALHHSRGNAAPLNLLPSERNCFDVLVAELERMRRQNLEMIRDAVRTQEGQAGEKPNAVKKIIETTAHSDDKQEVRDASVPGTLQKDLQKEYMKITMLGPLERFVGTDGNVYGPVNAGDVLVVPADLARFLLGRKLASAA